MNREKEFDDVALKYAIGTEVIFISKGYEYLGIFCVYKYQSFIGGNHRGRCARYVLRRLSDGHQISMVSEMSIKAVFEIREDKIKVLLDE